MKLTDIVNNAGRTIAFWPGLTKLTGSTSGTLFLSQMMYWSDKFTDKDGWIWKTIDEISEETGMTYYEVKSARLSLAKLGLLVVERRRIEHSTRYKIDKDLINQKWEEVVRGALNNIDNSEKEKDEAAEKQGIMMEEDEALAAMRKSTAERKANRESSTPTPSMRKKGGDLVDGVLNAQASAASRLVDKKQEVKLLIIQKFKLNPNGKRWEDFIEYAAERWLKNNEDFNTFVTWSLDNGFHPVYWTPDKMQILWPQAFAAKEEITAYEQSFLSTPVKKKEEVSVPPPAHLSRKA